MKLHLIILVLTTLAAWTTAIPIPQTSSACSSSSIQRRQTTVTVGTILTTDPCPPATYNAQVEAVDSLRASAESTSTGKASIESFGSWWNKTWSKIRNAIKSAKITINITWDQLMAIINNIAGGSDVQPNPDDSNGLIVVPPNGDMAEATYYHWVPPPTIPKDPGCGVNKPGQPARECP